MGGRVLEYLLLGLGLTYTIHELYPYSSVGSLYWGSPPALIKRRGFGAVYSTGSMYLPIYNW